MAKASTGVTSVIGKQQTFLYPETYLDEEDWNVVVSQTIPRPKKMERLVRRLLRLNIKHLKETSKLNCVSLILLFDPEMWKIDPTDVMKSFKTILDYQARHLDAEVMGLAEYPSSAVDLKVQNEEIYNKAYYDGEPVPSKACADTLR